MGTQRPQKGHSPNFPSMFIVAKRLAGSRSTWYKGRPRPRRRCVRWGPSSPPERGTAAPPLSSPLCSGTVAHLSWCWALVSSYFWFYVLMFLHAVLYAYLCCVCFCLFSADNVVLMKIINIVNFLTWTIYTRWHIKTSPMFVSNKSLRKSNSITIDIS